MNDREANVINEFKKEISFVPYFNGLRNVLASLKLSDFPQMNGQFYALRGRAHPQHLDFRELLIYKRCKT